MNSWANVDINERIRIYTGDFKALTKTVPKAMLLSTADHSDKPDRIHIMSISEHLLNNYVPSRPHYWKGQNNWSIFKSNSNYNNKYFSLLWGDNSTEAIDLPFLSKVRLIEQPGMRVLMRFNYHRHWAYLDLVRKIRNYNNFKNKKSIIHWRGSTTGYKGSKVRYEVVSKYYNNTVCDIAYSNICQGFKLENPNHCKGKATPQEMIKHKYVLSIDGNDKASDLNWKLASDSLVFMNHPRFESWLMESKLEPWVHYVPVGKDFSDLIEKYQWAENNQDKCIQIIKNANLFMDSNFGDIEKEKKIEQLVLKYYLDNVDINLE